MSWVLNCCGPRSRSVETRYDPRFGAAEISAPAKGAYSSPTGKPPNSVVQPRHIPTPLKPVSVKASPTFSNTNTVVGSAQPNSPFGSSSTTSNSSMPVHEAYIPSTRFSMQTVTMTSPVHSPPSSPPLPTPRSTASHHSHEGPRRGSSSAQNSLLPVHLEMDHERVGGPRGTIHNTMNSAPKNSLGGLDMRKLSVPEKDEDSSWTPKSERSVEQWPGCY